MKPNKRVIGLTGTIASGKSSVARYLEQQYHIPRIDADQVGHQVVDQMAAELAAEFGHEILEQGRVNRSKLGSLVFGDPEKLQRLNQLTHPVICRQIADWIKQSQAPVIMVEAIELLRSELKDQVQEIWAVYAAPEVRIRRMTEERGIPEAEARKRVASQWDDGQYLAKADRLLDGGGSLDELYRQCDRIMQDAKTSI